MSINLVTDALLNKTERLNTVFASLKEYNVALNRYLRYSTNKDYITLHIHNPDKLVSFIKENYLSKITFGSVIAIIYEGKATEYITKHKNQQFLRSLAHEFDSVVIEYYTYDDTKVVSFDEISSHISDFILVVRNLNNATITKDRTSTTPPITFSINEIINISRDLIIDDLLK